MCTVVEDFDTGDWSGVKVKLPAGYQVMSRWLWSNVWFINAVKCCN